MRLTQAILPVAGLGTRFLPWTKVTPKELLPIGRMPIIALLVDECLSVGIREICFVISRGKESIIDFFRTDEKLEAELARRGKSDLLRELTRYHEITFHTVYQEEQRGDGHAVLQAAPWVHAEHVAVLFGDDLILGEQNGLEQLAEHYREGAILCLQDVPRHEVSRYGIASVDHTHSRLKVIKGLVEKPHPAEAPSTLAIVGKYILPRALFDVLAKREGGLPPVALAKGGEIRIIDALIDSLGTIPVYGYVFEGKRFDTGTPEGYRDAVLALG